MKGVIKAPSLQGGKNAERVQMVDKGSLDTNEVVKCEMTFKGSKYGGIYCYKTFIRTSSKLAATIQKRDLQTVATSLKTLPDSAVLKKENSLGGIIRQE